MKIGVITFQSYNNYGAILQCYGLQHILKEMGHDVQLINYQCEYIDKPYRLINLKQKGIWQYLYGVIGYICYLPRRRKFNELRKKMSYSAKVTRKELKENLFDFEAYIAGSDQIWNYKLTNFDKTYFLDFVKEKKKFSYAASLGECQLDAQKKEEYQKLLTEFDCILTREQDAADVLKNLLGIEAEVVLDPTLLVDRNIWSSMSIAPKNKKPYILVYQLGISPQVVDFGKKLSKKTGLRIEYVPFPLGKYVTAKYNIAAGPQEWLGLFENASYVVTDSFHGIAFSVLFNRPFWVQVSGHHKNKRAENFLKLLGLTERSIENAKLDSDFQEIDYERVNDIVETERKFSIEKLDQMLKLVKE